VTVDATDTDDSDVVEVRGRSQAPRDLERFKGRLDAALLRCLGRPKSMLAICNRNRQTARKRQAATVLERKKEMMTAVTMSTKIAIEIAVR
jgi:hypothetical protein